MKMNVFVILVKGLVTVCFANQDSECKSKSHEYHLQWFYDDNAGKCRTFRYYGCRGNGNRFPSLAACNRACTYEGQPGGDGGFGGSVVRGDNGGSGGNVYPSSFLDTYDYNRDHYSTGGRGYSSSSVSAGNVGSGRNGGSGTGGTNGNSSSYSYLRSYDYLSDYYGPGSRSGSTRNANDGNFGNSGLVGNSYIGGYSGPSGDDYHNGLVSHNNPRLYDYPSRYMDDSLTSYADPIGYDYHSAYYGRSGHVYPNGNLYVMNYGYPIGYGDYIDYAYPSGYGGPESNSNGIGFDYLSGVYPSSYFYPSSYIYPNSYVFPNGYIYLSGYDVSNDYGALNGYGVPNGYGASNFGGNGGPNSYLYPSHYSGPERRSSRGGSGDAGVIGVSSGNDNIVGERQRNKVFEPSNTNELQRTRGPEGTLQQRKIAQNF